MAEKALGQSERSILEIVISREPFMLKISKNSKKSKKILGNHFWEEIFFFAPKWGSTGVKKGSNDRN